MLLLYYIYNEKNINSQLEAQWLADLPEAKSTQLSRLRIVQKRHLSLLGLQLLALGAKQLQLADFSLAKVGFPARDKPRHPDCDFSISHSANLVICAISTQQKVGIDAEHIRPIKPDIFKRHLSTTEREKSTANPTQFFHYWTQKEAIVKAADAGGIKAIPDIQLADGGGQLANQWWHTCQLELDSNYVVYLATDQQIDTPNPEQVDINQLI